MTPRHSRDRRTGPIPITQCPWVAKTSLPPSDGETVRNDTTYSYFDNGWARSSTDPWDITTAYDYNELGQQIKRTLTSAGGSSDRTMSWSYYPDSSLKSRADDGVPVGKSVVLADNSDTQNTSKTGTWAKGDITGQQGYNHETHTAGTELPSDYKKLCEALGVGEWVLGIEPSGRWQEDCGDGHGCPLPHCPHS
nr:hypothetical protein OG999_20700 [Streptomyces sp. NBC_00886]